MGSERPLVLIVEDELLVRTLISDILHDAGFGIIEVKGATEAVGVLEARADVRVLVTDADMPGASGFDLARQVSERWPHIGILVTSGRIRPGPDDLPGRTTFLPKPWTAEILVHSVQEAVESAIDKG